MADVSGPSVSIEENLAIPGINEPDGEPEAKKQKIDHSSTKIKFKLEDRLCGILCCAVCLDLPTMSVYQVGICCCFHFILPQSVIMNMAHPKNYIACCWGISSEHVSMLCQQFVKQFPQILCSKFTRVVSFFLRGIYVLWGSHAL